MSEYAKLLTLYFTYDLIYFIDYIPSEKSLEGIIDSMEKVTPSLRKTMEEITDELAEKDPYMAIVPAKAILHFQQMLDLLKREHMRQRDPRHPDDFTIDRIDPELFYMHHGHFHSALRSLILADKLNS